MSGDEARYRALGEQIRFHAGAGEEVVIDVLSGGVRALSAEQAKVLAACRGSRSLDAHAEEVGRRLGSRGPAPATVRALVETLARSGLLVSEAALHAKVVAAARPPSPRPSIEMVGIPTNGRLAGVAASVRAHAAVARAAGREVTFVIADGAAGDAAAEALAALRELSSEGIAIRVADRAARLDHAALLAERAGVDRSIVESALLGDARLGVDTGANRNALLLDAAGAAHLQTDDDVRPRAARAPDAREGLAFVAGDPNEMWFGEPGQPLVAPERWSSPDVFALHESLLGADVARLAVDPASATLPGAADTSAAGAAFFRRLVKRGGRVAVTLLGGAGDHGMAASFPLLLLGGPSRERLLASEARFREAFERRLLVRCPPRAAIADGASCMTMSVAIDTRGTVPPFAPSGRDSDGLFGALLRACVPDSFSAHLPWALEHVPPTPRSTSIDAERRAAGSAAPNELIRAALASVFDPRDVHSDALLARAGLALVHLASRPDDAEALFREQVMRGLARRLAQIERALAEHGRRPLFWAQALDGFASALRAALTSPHAHLPAELVAAHGPVAARALFLGHVATTGRLLAAWPAIFRAACDLRAEGRRLSRAVVAG